LPKYLFISNSFTGVIDCGIPRQPVRISDVNIMSILCIIYLYGYL
jgi:hypothetical protein